MELYPRNSRKGVALVIILAFLVLLVGVAIAFLSRAITERQVSNSSTGETKADILARGGLDIILGDINQEIVNGSITPAPTPAPGVTLYFPKTNINAVPVRDAAVSALTGTLAIPNLIRVSGTTAPASPAVETALASPNSLSTGTSANGRSVNIERWNAHYLIPLANASGTNIDTTPVASFANIAPGWVMVTSTGPAVITSPNSSVIGRYAYAIYDEGGLLDMNVAGYPSSISGTTAGLRGGEFFADLSQIGLSNTGGTVSNQQDSLLGWRNYATLQASGSLSAGYNFQGNAVSGSNYYQYVTTSSNGFMMLNSRSYSNRTDQIFNSRQDLIKFARAENWNQNLLQYMATFTRDIEQPSYMPPSNRPRIQSGAGVTLAGAINSSANITTYGTGNDGYGNDDAINPSILTIRTTGTFLRNDGSMAAIGEPLVKKRFPLSRLGLILYNSTAERSQTDPIYKNFGLYRSDPSQPWQYDHRAVNDGSIAGVLRLSQVASWVDPATGDVGRDPDFFELLKAAIDAGSLAKGAAGAYNGQDWTVANTAFNIQQGIDNSVDLHILQIGANVIDQTGSSNIPTRISFANDTVNFVNGIQDLPYIYRVRDRPVQATANTGEFLFLPELWNPHAQNGTASPSPVSFRFRVAAVNPSATNQLQITYRGVNAPLTPLTLNASWANSLPLTFNGGEPTYYGFREPTLLAESGQPAGTNLNGHTTSEYAPAGFAQPPGRTLVGISPIYSTGTTSFPWNPDGNITHCAVKANYANLPVIYCYLDYQDPNTGAWVTYDQQVFQWNQSTSFNIYTPLNVWDINSTANEVIMAATRTDPRTSRWGMPHTNFANDIQPITPGNSSYAYPSLRWTSGLSYGHHIGGITDNGFVGSSMTYSASIYPDYDFRGFDSGYWEENTIRAIGGSATDPYGRPLSAPQGNTVHYDRSADGVVRRAMGGYASDPLAGGSTSNIVGLPMAIAANNANGQSRPIILHRPFRSVAELGYVFRGTPWSNLNTSFPESGDAALLDVFCVNEVGSSGLVAGRVDVNTRQTPVLQALIAGALADVETSGTLSSTQAGNLAASLVTRTTGATASLGPLTNRAEIIGHYYGSGSPSDPNPDDSYAGFSYDIGQAAGVNGTAVALVPRLHDAAIRALTDSTTARTWNLLIDIVAQSGRYPSSATNVANFVVEGEKRYWLHVAIDRDTGQILDKQLEPVTE